MRSSAASVALLSLSIVLPSSAMASRLEKAAIEVGPGIEPPSTDPLYATSLTEIPAALDGTVVARVLIDTAGEVRKIKIMSSTDSRLSNFARQLMEGRKYTPAKRGNVPVPVWWTENLRFVSAAAEIAVILACDPSKLGTSPPSKPRPTQTSSCPCSSGTPSPTSRLGFLTDSDNSLRFNA